MTIEPYMHIAGGFQPLDQLAWFMTSSQPTIQVRCSKTVEPVIIDQDQAGNSRNSCAKDLRRTSAKVEA
jgi:hypothetical protein